MIVVVVMMAMIMEVLVVKKRKPHAHTVLADYIALLCR